ncbi:MAG: PASTA domain-containing protein [Candidatus Krumholzibacteria bacterium]|nr:PASTA domain-containing protein [Candidatus Krumholzibacteria bacterium]
MTEPGRGRVIHPLALYGLIAVGAFAVGMAIFQFIVLPIITGRGDIVIVPDMKGMPVAAAEEACSRRGLKIAIVGERSSDEVPAGCVLEQDPASGEGLKGRRTVRVIASSGERMEAVPDLIGGSLREADLAIEGAGLRRGRISRIFTHDGGQNRVAALSPPPGTAVANGSPVDLLLCMTGEPRVFLMPDLRGTDAQFVRERLERGGFHVTRVVPRRDDSRFPGTIISQTPPPGYSIKEGGTIELVVSTVD